MVYMPVCTLILFCAAGQDFLAKHKKRMKIFLLLFFNCFLFFAYVTVIIDYRCEYRIKLASKEETLVPFDRF